MGTTNAEEMFAPARSGKDLSPADPYVVADRGIGETHRYVFVDKAVQDPQCCVALLPGRAEISRQHAIDRSLVGVELR